MASPPQATGASEASAPGLYIYRSNRAEVLVELLAELLRAPGDRPQSPFEPIEITVGSLGMERWLRHELAVRHGVCANVAFPFPAQLIDRVLGRSSDAGPDPWSPEVMTWRLLEVLAEKLPEWGEAEGADALRGYLDADTDGSAGAEDGASLVEVRELELAARLADIFDGYVTYRPQWARAASAGRLALDPKDPLRWQIPLWRALADTPHAADRLSELMGAKTPVALPFHQPVRLFGLSALTPALLGVLDLVSRQHAVELYVVCPSDAWWAELHRHRRSLRPLVEGVDRTELSDRMRELLGHDASAVRPHPLLSALGRVARDLQLSLETLPDRRVRKRDVFVDLGPEGPLEAFPDPAADRRAQGTGSVRALWRLQSDMLNLRDPTQRGTQGLLDFTAADDSIQIHSCHGATRQVEVLRDALLHLFDRHPHLEPRDVVVMCPDIDVYAPLISAVFDQGRAAREHFGGEPDTSPAGWGPAGAPRIPYQVADLSVRRQNPVADALLRVLALGGEGERVTATAVLDLLALEPVRRRFDLGEEDLEWIARWIREVGVRWGIDADDRARHGQPALLQNTWQFGLERLALGVAIADDGPLLTPSTDPERRIAPFDPLEGGRVVLVGRAMEFCRALFDQLEALERPATVVSWVARFEHTLDELTRVEGEATWLRTRVNTALEALAAAAVRAGSQRPVSRAAIRRTLEDRFSVASASAQPHTGAVTFGTLMPYRSVPYAVVCLLGMDEDAFPRNPVRPGFDRVALEPRVGDRDIRDEDRHLLLEAIGSAREHLIITYAGRDVRTNEPRPPAPPIGELLDVLEATLGASTLAQMRVEHPLQAFSPRNFQPGSVQGAGPWSFDRRLRAGAEALVRGERRTPTFLRGPELDDALRRAPEIDEAVTFDDLVGFFRNPARFLLQRRFGVYLGERERGPSDREPVEVDSLRRWMLVDDLLEIEAEDARAKTEHLVQLRARGELPFGIAGELAVDAGSEAVGVVLAQVAAAVPGYDAAGGEQTRPFVLGLPLGAGPALDTRRLVGSVGGIHGSDLVRVAAGKLDGKRLLEPWLRYLVTQAIGPDDDPTWPVVERCVLGTAKAAAPASGKAPEVTLTELRLPTADAEGRTPRAQARHLLARYLGWYTEGQRRPIPLFDKASYAFIEKLRHKKSPFDLAEVGLGRRIAAGQLKGEGERAWVDAALDDARKAFEGGKWRGDGQEPHVARVWPGGWTDDGAFIERAMGFWWPVFEARANGGAA